MKGPRVKAIRVIAVGLFASAVLMIHLSIRLFQNSEERTILHTLLQAMRQVDSNLFPGVGLGWIALIALTLASMGIGLLVAVLVYSPIHDFLSGLFSGRLLIRVKAAHGDAVNEGSTKVQ